MYGLIRTTALKLQQPQRNSNSFILEIKVGDIDDMAEVRPPNSSRRPTNKRQTMTRLSRGTVAKRVKLRRFDFQNEIKNTSPIRTKFYAVSPLVDLLKNAQKDKCYGDIE